MSQQLVRLIPQLKVPVQPTFRRFRNSEGPYGRLKIMRRVVNDLFRDERIQANFYLLDEARPYAERLIADAIRLGDEDQFTMDMANFWLPQRELIYKLFQVLAPRFSEQRGSFTRMLRLPQVYNEANENNSRRMVSYKDTVLELKGHPFPPLISDRLHENPRRLLHNVLLESARRSYEAKKLASLNSTAGEQAASESRDESAADNNEHRSEDTETVHPQ